MTLQQRICKKIKSCVISDVDNLFWFEYNSFTIFSVKETIINRMIIPVENDNELRIAQKLRTYDFTKKNIDNS